MVSFWSWPAAFTEHQWFVSKRENINRDIEVFTVWAHWKFKHQRRTSSKKKKKAATLFMIQWPAFVRLVNQQRRRNNGVQLCADAAGKCWSKQQRKTNNQKRRGLRMLHKYSSVYPWCPAMVCFQILHRYISHTLIASTCIISRWSVCVSSLPPSFPCSVDSYAAHRGILPEYESEAPVLTNAHSILVK